MRALENKVSLKNHIRERKLAIVDRNRYYFLNERLRDFRVFFWSVGLGAIKTTFWEKISVVFLHLWRDSVHYLQ